MSDYGDILGDLFDSFAQPDPAKRAQASMKRASERIAKNDRASTPAPRLHVKRIDGKAFIPAGEVAELLEANGVPGTAKKLRALDRTPP